MALFTILPRFSRFQKILPRRSFQPAPSQFSLSINHTSMALDPYRRIFPFLKILPPWLFSACPLEFFHFQKSYLHGSFHTASRIFPFQKILPPWLFSGSPLEFFHFKNITSMSLLSHHFTIFQFQKILSSSLS